MSGMTVRRRFPMTKANFRHDKYDFDLAVYEINIEAVFFCFD
jgi:hypothetical protein